MDEAQIESIVDELRYYIDLDSEEKSNREIILEHIDEVIEYCDRYLVSEFLAKEAVYDPDYEKYISEHLEELVNYIPVYNLSSFLGVLAEYFPDTIMDNMDYIISEKNIPNFWSVFVSIKGRNEDIDKVLNVRLHNSNYFESSLVFQFIEKQQIENSHKYVLKSERNENTDEEKEDLANLLKNIIEKTLQETRKDYTDIEFEGDGVFSMVYIIGDKALKIGSELHEFNIPNHRRLLQPLYRKNYLSKAGTVFGCIQLFPKTDTYIPIEDKTDENLYQIYKDFRKDKIIPIDIKWENLSKLLSDNIPTWNGRRLHISPESVGLDGEKRWVPLKKGEIVMHDLDMVYRENDPNIPWEKMSDDCKRLEEKYEEELRSKDNKDLDDEDAR